MNNAESYFSEIRFDYSLTKQFYYTASAGWKKDRFAGLEHRYYIGPGVGYRFFTGPKHFFLGEAGFNYTTEKYTNDTDNEFLAGRTFAQYSYGFTAKNKFAQSLEFLYDFSDSNNFNLNSETALISALNDYLSLKAAYEIKYDNEPVPATLEKTDTLLSMTLVVSF